MAGSCVSPRAGMLRAAVVVVLMAAASAAVAQEFDEKSALAQSRAAVGTRLADHSLLTAGGERIALSSFRGKPLLISLIFTSCDHTCPMMTSQLASAVEAARDAMGTDSFNVLSIGFDTRNDTPDRMARFAADRGIDDPRWTFAAADPDTIEALTRELGFTYFASPRGFDHLDLGD